MGKDACAGEKSRRSPGLHAVGRAGYCYNLQRKELRLRGYCVVFNASLRAPALLIFIIVVGPYPGHAFWWVEILTVPL